MNFLKYNIISLSDIEFEVYHDLPVKFCGWNVTSGYSCGFLSLLTFSKSASKTALFDKPSEGTLAPEGASATN